MLKNAYSEESAHTLTEVNESGIQHLQILKRLRQREDREECTPRSKQPPPRVLSTAALYFSILVSRRRCRITSKHTETENPGGVSEP